MRFKPVVYLFMMVVFVSSPCKGEEAAPYVVYVENAARGEVLMNVPVREGDRFFLDYLHSSDKTPVHDVFEISREGEMILIEENFSWHGAGLEFMNWEGAWITSEENKIRVRLNRPFPFLLLRVGRIANHTLHFPDRVVPLKEIARGGELLKIWVAPRDPS